MLGARPLTVAVPSRIEGAGYVVYVPICTLISAPVFLFVSFFAHEVQRFAGFHGCTIFLDKTCIHQEDKAKQRQGILKLGAFVRSSSQMLVIYTGLYLTKLWTVYEIACFLSQHPAQSLVIVPTYQPVLVFGGVAIAYMRLLLVVLCRSQGWPALPAFTSTGFLAALGVAILFRRWARAKEAIRRRVANFQVTECTCFHEDDRSLVHHNIALLMRAIGEVDDEVTEECACDAFNVFVRRKLSTSITASIGSLGLSYVQVVAMFSIDQLSQAVDSGLLAQLPYPEGWITHYRIFSMVYFSMWVFGLFPLVTALLSAWCGQCLKLRSCAEGAFLILGVVLVVALFVALEMVIDRFFWASVQLGPHRKAFAVVMFAFLIVSVSLAVAVFRQARRFHDEEELAEAEAEAGGVAAAEVEAATSREAASAANAEELEADIRHVVCL